MVAELQEKKQKRDPKVRFLIACRKFDFKLQSPIYRFQFYFIFKKNLAQNILSSKITRKIKYAYTKA